MALNFKQTLDNSDFKKKLEESTNAIKNSGKTAEEIGKKVENAIQNYTIGTKELLDVANKDFKEQSQIIKQVTSDIEQMQAKLANMPPSSAQQELTKDLIAAKQALKEETAILNEKKDALDKVSQAYKENSSQTEKTANKLTTLRTQTRIAREELSKMEQEGLRGTQAYTDLQNRLGALTDQMNDTQQQARVLADDEKYLTATIQAISGIAGAFSVAQGAVGLFGEENENLQRIMLKVQSLMAITIGLQQVAQVVNKDSAVSILFLSKAQNALATSLGISAAAAKVFMIAITGGLVIGLMALMNLFDKLSQKRKEDEEKTKEQTKAQEEFYKTIGDNAAKSLTEFTILQKQYNKVGDTFAAKNKFLQENKKKYEELGLAIKSVADQENLLIKNKDAYINSVISKAYADAYRADIAKKFAEVIKLENAPLQYKSETKVIKTNEMVFAGDAMVRKTDVVFDEDKTQKNIEAAMNAREKAVNTLKSQIVKDTEKLVDLENQSAEDLRKAGINQVTENKKQQDLKDISNYGKAITDMWQKIYQDIEQSKANAINNEFARTTELNVLNAKKELDELDKQIEAIKQKRIEQAKAEYVNNTGSEKGFVAPIITLTDEEKRTYEERAKQIIDNVYKLNQQAYENLIGDYQTYEERREQIQKEYGERRKEFTELGLLKNIEELNKIEQERLSELDNSFVSKQASFISWLENITNLTQKQLENQIKIAKKSIENGDLDEKTLAILRAKIKELETRLKEKKEELAEVDTKDLGFSNIIDKLASERKKLREELEKGEEADRELVKAYKENIESLEKALSDKTLRYVSYTKDMIRLMKDFTTAIGGANSELSVMLNNFEVILSKVEEGVSFGGEVGGGLGALIGGIVGGILGAIELYVAQQQEMEEKAKKREEGKAALMQRMNEISKEYTYELMKQNQLLLEAQGLLGVDKEKQRLAYLQQYVELTNKLNDIMGTADFEYVFGYLLERFPELINEAGEINREILDYIYNSPLPNGQQWHPLIKEVLDMLNATEEAKQGLDNYLKDLFGTLRNDWMDNFVAQMMRGEDAMYSFKESISDTLLELMKQSIYSAYFSNIFSALEKGIEDINLLNPEDRNSQIANLLMNTVNALESALPEAEATWRELQGMFNQIGFDITNSRTATAQGIQSISQESADRIDGMLTSVQGSIIDIKDMQGTIRDSAISINENVIIIRNHTGEMAQKLDRIDYNINQMATNGINVN